MNLRLTHDAIDGTGDAANVWEVVLDRPGAANALSAELVEELHEILDRAETATVAGGAGSTAIPAPTALVLRGNRRHFAAGFDLSGLHDESDESLAVRFLRIGLLLERLESLPVLTIAAVEGAAYGAGADLVAACDVRLATSSAGFRFPGAGFGVVLGTARLAALVGTDVALSLAGGPRIDAAEAARIGLVTEIPDNLDVAVRRRVEAWSATDPTARGALLAEARVPRPSGEPLAALTRSVVVPGLRERIAAYAGLTFTPAPKEHA